MQDVDTIFEVDTIKHIRDAVISKCDVVYGENQKQDISIRIITDHVKAITFMVGDGIMPNNEGRGYVLRRLLRRAARHAKTLGMTGNVLTELVEAVMAAYGESYPNLLARKDYIQKIISVEEERFQTTIDQGLMILTDYMDALKAENKTVLSGENAFRLYDTYGFPLELTLEILEEYQMTVDEDEFQIQMTMQKERARSARESGDELGWAQDALGQLPKDMASEFVGYDEMTSESKVLAIVGETLLDEAFEGMEVSVVLDKTPFYPEGGGQVFDTGKLSTSDFEADVEETRKSVGKLIALHVKVNKGNIKVGDTVLATVDEDRRLATARNHSTTHLLHKALREVLGTHVEQAGSMVSPERLRFDFSHFEAISYEDLMKIETRVNEQILKRLPIQTESMSIEAAREKGAMALFGEKYGESVRVVTMGDFSIELCGGTHLKNTAEAGLFKIVSETGVAAGVRRIEAITGENVYKMLTQLDGKIQRLSDMLKANQNDLEQKAETLLQDLKQAQRENEKLKNKLVTSDLESIIKSAQMIKEMNVVTAEFKGIDMNTLRNLADEIKTKLEKSVVVLANTDDDNKVQFLAMVSDEAIKLGAHAGNLIREVAKVAGGGGGGKPNMAQAGGKNPEKVEEALEKVYELLS